MFNTETTSELSRAFSHATAEIQRRFSYNTPSGFYVVLTTDCKERYADSFRWSKDIGGETFLTSQSRPYKVPNDMRALVETVGENPIEKMLVCDERAALPLWEWVVRRKDSGLYLLERQNGRLMDLCILDGPKGSDMVRNTIPQLPAYVPFVLR